MNGSIDTRLCSRIWTTGLALGLMGGVLTAAEAARSQWVYAVDTTIEATGVVITPRDAATDLGAGPIAVAPPTVLPVTSRLNALQPDGADTLFTTREAVLLSGSLFASAADIVRTDGTTHAIEFDALAAGLPRGVAVDAVAIAGNGDLLLSFDVSLELSGAFHDDEDLVGYDGAVFYGFFDGSAASIPTTLDLDGAHLDAAVNSLLVSFDSAGSVGGVVFAREDILRFDRDDSSWSLAFDASARDAAFATSDLVAVPEPNAAFTVASAAATLALLSYRRRSRIAR